MANTRKIRPYLATFHSSFPSNSDNITREEVEKSLKLKDFTEMNAEYNSYAEAAQETALWPNTGREQRYLVECETDAVTDVTTIYSLRCEASYSFQQQRIIPEKMIVFTPPIQYKRIEATISQSGAIPAQVIIISPSIQDNAQQNRQIARENQNQTATVSSSSNNSQPSRQLSRATNSTTSAPPTNPAPRTNTSITSFNFRKKFSQVWQGFFNPSSAYDEPPMVPPIKKKVQASETSKSSNTNEKNNVSETLRDYPENCYCSITAEVFKNPVMLIATGMTYERDAIEKWFATGKKTCPMTGTELTDLKYVTNFAIKGIIDDINAHNKTVEDTLKNNARTSPSLGRRH